jgi:hypothetical protein
VSISPFSTLRLEFLERERLLRAQEGEDLVKHSFGLLHLDLLGGLRLQARVLECLEVVVVHAGQQRKVFPDLRIQVRLVLGMADVKKGDSVSVELGLKDNGPSASASERTKKR